MNPNNPIEMLKQTQAMQWWITNRAEMMKNVFIFALIIIVGYFAIQMVLGITRRALRRSDRVSNILAEFTISVLHKVLWGVLLMMALPRLGVDVAPLIATLGVSGFIIGFACQESLSNLAAGVMLMLNRPFDEGHYVEAGGTAGTVQAINIMATVLHTPDNRRVTVPNSKIWGGQITNYSALPTRRVDLKVGIGYGADIGKAMQTVQGVLSAHEKVLAEPAPTLGVVEMADSSVEMVVRPWCNNPDYWDVYFTVTRQIKEAFDREGIQIPYPQLDVHVEKIGA